MQAEFASEGLFPKRGKELNFTVNGKPRIARGDFGEAAIITVNGNEADIYTQVRANDQIKVIESTAGGAAQMEISQLPEFGAKMWVEVNGKKIDLPKFASVNGKLQSGYYSIQENDEIEILGYYTVRQIAEFMDVVIDWAMNIYVNNKIADMDTKVYENFSVIWTMEELQLSDVEIYEPKEPVVEKRNRTETSAAGTAGFTAAAAKAVQTAAEEEADDGALEKAKEQDVEEENRKKQSQTVSAPESGKQRSGARIVMGPGIKRAEAEARAKEEAAAKAREEEAKRKEAMLSKGAPVTIQVMVNQEQIRLSGKKSYIFVDVFEYIDFDLSKPQGSGIVTTLNGRDAQYMEKIKSGDVIEIYWKD